MHQEMHPRNKEERHEGTGLGQSQSRSSIVGPAAPGELWEPTGPGNPGTAGQMLLHPRTCWEHPAMWLQIKSSWKGLSTRSSYGGHVSATEGAGEWGLAPSCRGHGAAARGWTSSRATHQKPDLTGGTGMLNAASTLPCCSLPAQPLCSHHGTFSPARILSWQRMGNDESSSPQPHPARPKESSAAFEVAFKGSRNED